MSGLLPLFSLPASLGIPMPFGQSSAATSLLTAIRALRAQIVASSAASLAYEFQVSAARRIIQCVADETLVNAK